MPITAIIVSRFTPATIQPSFGIEGRTHGHNRGDRDYTLGFGSVLLSNNRGPQNRGSALHLLIRGIASGMYFRLILEQRDIAAHLTRCWVQNRKLTAQGLDTQRVITWNDV